MNVFLGDALRGRRAVKAAALALVLGIVAAPQAPTEAPTPDQRTDGSFRPRFAASGLVTNEYASRKPHDPAVRLSGDWKVTSGSLFARDGAAWTGPPDSVGPDALSARGTNSAVFRLVSRRRDLANVRVSFRLRINRQVATVRNPARDYDGVHVWARYADEHQLYAVSVMRRDGTVAIKRKARRGARAEGSYATLAQARAPLAVGQWVPIVIEARDHGGRVTLTLSVDGRQILAAEDRPGMALLGAGGVGVRGDNTEFEFKDFRADPLA
jgi:hypothetical protein